MQVAVKQAPPFVFKSPQGNYTGIAINLWQTIAEELGLNYQYAEVDSVPELLDGVAQGRYDVGLGAISITAERLKKVDFTQPYFHSGLGIAVPSQHQSSLMDLMRNVFSFGFLKAVAGLAALLLTIGLVLWWFERHRNSGMFSNDAKGVGSAFWWAAVTMTTVGYGDKVPVTLGGRLVATVWMFAAIILISGFTAAIATSLTLSGLQGEVRGPKDLQRVTVATIAGTSSESFLRDSAIRSEAFPDLQAAMTAAAEGRLKALVFDRPMLRFQAAGQFAGRVEVLPVSFAVQNYGFVLPLGSPRRHALDSALLHATEDPAWDDIQKRYLGQDFNP